jgi:hypothetical protein
MSTGKFIGRVGALALALGVGFAPVSAQGVAVAESQDSTALMVCGGGCPTWDDASMQIILNQFITPTHPDQTISPVAVTTPSELWPVTGLLRLLVLAFGDPRLGRLDGPGWPDEPWWKLSGLFDLTAGQSLREGAADLDAAIAEHGNEHLVIYGYSMGAGVTNVEKKKLAAQYPAGTTPPDIDFVLGGDPNLPNGGLAARFSGLYIPIIDFPFNGPAATDTQFKTIEINRQYDGFTDFPLYPLNIVADLNAVLGIAYVHTHPFDVSLPEDPTTSPAYQGTHGDTSYYFFQTQDLPLFAPLRQLGVPEPLIDVVEPFFRSIVELGYDRSIPPWEPTPARLIPPLNPAKVTSDLVSAVGEGINNALALVGSPAPSSSPKLAPVQGLRTNETVAAADTRAGVQPVASSAQVTDDTQMSTDTDTSTTHRRVARHSLGSDEQQPRPPKHGKKTEKAESSSAASTSADPPSKESPSSGDDSSGAHADGSESST